MQGFFSDSLMMYTVLTYITIFTLVVEILCIRATSLQIAKWFEIVFYLVIVATLCEWIAAIGKIFPNEMGGFLVLCKTLEMVVAPVIAVSVALSVARERAKLIHVIPLAIHVLIILSNIFTKKIFYFAPDNTYHHASWYFLYQISYFSSVFYMFYKLIVISLKEKEHNMVVLILSLLLVLFGLIVQAIFSDIRVDWCTVALASTLICLNYVTQDQKKAVDDMTVAVDEAKRANKAKTSFMGRMSHDLRTPINGIMGMVQIARKNLDNEEVVTDCLEKIDTSNRHLLSLVSDILQMTSLESGAIKLSHEKFDLNEIIDQCREVLVSLADERGVRLIDDQAKEVPIHKLVGSPVHVKQIFINIISNAIKYNRMGGFVEIKTAIIGQTPDQVIYRFTFSDTGLGMSDEFLKNIYEPFSREEDPVASTRTGSGLGMSIVKELVTLMGGNISAISEKNVGTIFTVDLPFEIDNTPEEGDVFDKNISFSGKRVLLVEDNDLNQEIAMYLLEEKGFEVDTATNGKEAVGKYLSSSPFYYDIILMDIMMPVMNGLEATTAIRDSGRTDADLPIIAMTANAYDEDKKECRDRGMNDHISKPLEEKEMFSSIMKWLK